MDFRACRRMESWCARAISNCSLKEIAEIRGFYDFSADLLAQRCFAKFSGDDGCGFTITPLIASVAVDHRARLLMRLSNVAPRSIVQNAILLE